MPRPKKTKTRAKRTISAPTSSGRCWRVSLTDGEERVIADRYSTGTDYIQFWTGDRQVAMFRTPDVEKIEDGGQETELLAEVRAEGEGADGAVLGGPDPDAA